MADLEGKALAVAGRPVDKSDLMLRAYIYAKTGKMLPAVITTYFGALPLVNEMLVGGPAQAALDLWDFNARARWAGMEQLVSVKDMPPELGVSKRPPLLGWAFSEKVARAKKEEITRFLDASFATKDKLLTVDPI